MLDLAEPLNLWFFVRDLEVAREFYGRKLGLPLWREEPAEALHFAAGGALLTVRRASDGDLPARGSRLVFTVPEDLDGVCEALQRRGLVFDQPLANRAFGRAAMVRDPDGHEIWLCRPSETETQFHRWRLAQRQQTRRVPVQRQAKVRRHEPPEPSRRTRHPRE